MSAIRRDVESLIAQGKDNPALKQYVLHVAARVREHVGASHFDKLSPKGQLALVALAIKNTATGKVPDKIVGLLHGNAPGHLLSRHISEALDRLHPRARGGGTKLDLDGFARGGYADGGDPAGGAVLELPDDPTVNDDSRVTAQDRLAAAQQFDSSMDPRRDLDAARHFQSGPDFDASSAFDRAIKGPPSSPFGSLDTSARPSSDLSAGALRASAAGQRAAGLSPSGRPTEAGLPEPPDLPPTSASSLPTFAQTATLAAAPVSSDVAARRRAAGDTSGDLAQGDASPPVSYGATTVTAQNGQDYTYSGSGDRRLQENWINPRTGASMRNEMSGGNPITRVGEAVGNTITNAVEGAGRAVLGTGHNFLNALGKFESGNTNVMNTHQSTSSGRAGGYYQITSGTWNDWAPRAGVDLSQYPNAMSAPQDVQAKVAANIPMGRWDPITLNKLRNEGWKINPKLTMAENALMNGDRDPRAFMADASGAQSGDSSQAGNPLGFIGDAAQNAVRTAKGVFGGGSNHRPGPRDFQDDASQNNQGGGWGGFDPAKAFGDNRSWIVPLLTGLGTMASSNSRYLGSAVLQGLGGGAQAYAQEQQAQANLGQTQANTGETRSRTGQVDADTQRQLLQNSQGVFFMGPGNTPMVHYVDAQGRLGQIDYGSFQQRAATERLRMATPEEVARYARGGMRPAQPAPVVAPSSYGPNGTVTPPAGGGFNPSFTAPPLGVTAPAGGYGESGAGVQQAPPPAPLPAAPSTQGTIGVSFSPASKADAAAERPFLYGDANKTQRDVGAQWLKDSNERSQAAADNRLVMREMAVNTASMISHGGAAVTGAFAPQRAAAIGTAQTVLRSLGWRGPLPTSQDTDEQISQKLSAFIGAQQAQGAGQQSHQAMGTIMSSLPGMHLTPEANATVAAQLLAAQQRDRDMGVFTRQYSGGNPNANTFHLASAAFNRDNSGYSDDAAYLRWMMLNKPQQFQQLMTHQGIKQDDFERRIASVPVPRGMPKPPPGISRYFY